MKIVVHAPEPKPAKKVEPVVGGVYACEDEYRLIVRIDDTLHAIFLRPGWLYHGENVVGTDVYGAVANGTYVLVENAELHVTPKEGA
jgi:hypothetical protein